jgi:hypothetical protein
MASATSSTNIISASKADIYAKLLAIAEKELPTDIDTTDFLKSSLFGYVTESMAMIARDSAIHSSMIYKESFLNTATMPKSVYNWAKMFNIEVGYATPAYADITVMISSDVLDNYLGDGSVAMSSAKFADYGSDVTSVVGDSNYGRVIVLNRKDPFIAGSVKFSLERSVMIYKGSQESGNDYVAKYVSTEQTSTSYGTYNSPFIRITKTSDGSIGFVVRVYQYETQETKKQITSSSFISTKVHEFTYTNQLAGMQLSSTKGSVTTQVSLDYTNLETTSSTDSTDARAYYSILGNNTIQVKFGESFVPTAGCTLKFDAYSTLGASGVMSYSDQLVLTPSDETFKKLAVSAYMTDGKSYGGSDAPTLSEIKSTIIDEISTRDTIVTESDLNSYFLKLTKMLKTIDGGSITFAKKRDDILRRVFAASIEMRTGLDRDGNAASSGYVSEAIPTDTLDVVYANPKSLGFSIDSTYPVVEASEYSQGYKFGDKMSDAATQVSSVSNGIATYKDYYIMPFYAYVTLSPYKRVKYIYDMTNDTSSLSFRSAAKLGPGMISPNSVSVKRGFSIDSYGGMIKSANYEFAFTFSGNYDFANQYSASNISIALKMYSSANSYVSIALGDSSNGATGSTYKIESSQSSTNSSVYTTTITASIPVYSDSEFSMESGGSYGSYINLGSDGSIKLAEDIMPEIDISGSISSSGISIACRSDEYMGLFRNLDDIISSDIEVKSTVAAPDAATAKANVTAFSSGWLTDSDEADITPTSGVYKKVTIDSNTFIVKGNGSSWDLSTAPSTINYLVIDDVPLVHSSYFYNGTTSYDDFIKQLYIYINMLRSSLSKLETNTFFDLKFANTHGRAHTYGTTTTNIRLELKIWLNSGYYDSTDSTGLQSEIRDCIRMFVDSANSNGELKVSQVIALTTAAFPDQIHHIDFMGLNGTFTQYVKALSLTDSEKSMYPKEYFNLDSANLDNDITFSEAD